MGGGGGRRGWMVVSINGVEHGDEWVWPWVGINGREWTGQCREGTGRDSVGRGRDRAV